MNTDTRIETKTGAWKFEQPLRLVFPKNWTVAHIRGGSLAAASADEIRARLDSPIGCAPLSKLLKNKKSAAILVDDPTRPTPVIDIVKTILGEVRAAGIPEHDVRVLVVPKTSKKRHKKGLIRHSN